MGFVGCTLVMCTSVGCVERNATTAQSSEEASSESTLEIDQVDRADLFRLAERLGLRGADPVVVSSPRSAPRNQSFVNMGSNGSWPRGGNGTFPRGAGSNGTMTRSWPLGQGNATFGPGSNGSFPLGNGSFPGGGMGANGTFPGAGGNATFANPRFVPLRGAGSRGLPLQGGANNTTFGGR